MLADPKVTDQKWLKSENLPEHDDYTPPANGFKSPANTLLLLKSTVQSINEQSQADKTDIITNDLHQKAETERLCQEEILNLEGQIAFLNDMHKADRAKYERDVQEVKERIREAKENKKALLKDIAAHTKARLDTLSEITDMTEAAMASQAKDIIET